MRRPHIAHLNERTSLAVPLAEEKEVERLSSLPQDDHVALEETGTLTVRGTNEPSLSNLMAEAPDGVDARPIEVWGTVPAAWR
mmetsp:Transcript_3142/g.6773  ORF Transcript_3142/g.6773 Transcript_3142/m.6773 type:complete len:83 (-) Transcript_3142:416-664(-)